MLSPSGRDFADAYFQYESGQYLADYEELLAADLPSLFQVKWTDTNYRLLAARIDQRYAAHRK